MSEIIPALERREGRQRCADSLPEFVEGASTGRPEQRFEFGKPQFNRIEVRAVRREIAERRADAFDTFAHAIDLVRRQVIHHDHIAWLEGWHQELIEVGEKTLAVHGSIKEAGRRQAVDAQPGDKRARLPMVVRGVIVDPRAPPTTPIAAEHVCRHATFIEKHQARELNARRVDGPLPASRHDVRPILFGRAHRFF